MKANLALKRCIFFIKYQIQLSMQNTYKYFKKKKQTKSMLEKIQRENKYS